MSSWDDAEAQAEAVKKDSGAFLKLSGDGESVKGIFMGDPLVIQQVWDGSHYAPFDPEKHKGMKMMLRFAFNLYVPEQKALKVFQGGVKFFDLVKMCRKKYGLDAWVFEITRSGAKGDTNTQYTVMPDEQIPESWKAQLGALQLHDLAKLCNSDGGGSGSQQQAQAPAAVAPTTAPDEAAHAKALLAAAKASAAAIAPTNEDDDLPF